MRAARERWATFSVKDHQRALPFVADVLLYDRLIIPSPPADAAGHRMWQESGWQPDRFEQIRGKLPPDVATFVPWGEAQREIFRRRAELARHEQAASAGQGYFVDSLGQTRSIVKDLLAPPPPARVKIWKVTAYPSADEAREDFDPDPAASPQDRREHAKARLALTLASNFLVPTGGKERLSVLEDAVDLATDAEFRKKRNAFRSWQDKVIEEELTDDQAIGEMGGALDDYNGLIRKAFRNSVVTTVAFTIVPIVISAITGALPVGVTLKTGVTLVNGGISITRLFAFTKKPNLDDHPGAMFHDARKVVFGH